MDEIVSGRAQRWAVPAALLALACGSPAWAGDGAAAAQADAVAAEPQPWAQPIGESWPIRRASSLKAEYRRIRALRIEQMQPEYERRSAQAGPDAAQAWRDATLRDIARQDLRDLRARLDR
ncbi:hypothetical protein MNO14_01125 [Luteimonas sp. S4-F44]|uniref:hypothetical protein n=1 Tax=Luteimonas sp. S4-F44 TaxID=2925842 RepID=UPI001F52F81C|nr:hypothetical protein [Luteimonas sp. S4-F44]UNK42738.1 hypothetical protein MNO14_01125 [Luteimonas sp. S4-F44]